MIKIVKEDDFDLKKETYLKMCEDNIDIRNAYETTSFEEGKKLYLEIEVTDRYSSQILFGLLYPKSNRVEGIENLGFELNAIHFRLPGTEYKEDVVVGLKNIISILENN